MADEALRHRRALRIGNRRKNIRLVTENGERVALSWVEENTPDATYENIRDALLAMDVRRTNQPQDTGDDAC